MIGTTWKVIEQTAAAEKAPVKAILPTEGATGWSDTWMISSKAKHPNCAYAWMSYITEPKPQSEVAQYFGEAPANGQACKLTGAEFCKAYHTNGQGLRRQALVLDHADLAVPGRTHRHPVHRLRRLDPGLDRDQGLTLAFSVRRSPGLRTGLLLLPPMLWLGVAYLAALGALLITSLWSQNDFTGTIERVWTLDNYRQMWEVPVYRTIAFRTIGIAALVTVVDALIAFPIALYMAKVASPRGRRLLVIAVLMPLWASYLVKAYAWRGMFSQGGLIDWLGQPFGIQSPGYGLTATAITLAYLWLPYMVLPIFAGLERVPDSLLEASGDLGAGGFTTLRRVVLPMAFPAIVAGSIFTFSLSLGDYIAVQIVGGTSQLLGNVIYINVGSANNLPFAAALSTIPIVVMFLYLAAARRTGALDNL